MILVVFICAALLYTLFSYVDQLYRERGRLLDRQAQEALEHFAEQVQKRIRVPDEQIALASQLWVGGSLITMGISGTLLLLAGQAQLADWAVALVLLGALIVFCGQVIPSGLMVRTSGTWLQRLLPLLRVAVLIIMPAVVITRFLLSLASLNEHAVEPDPEQQRESEIEALVEAGAEEGIIEESDRELVQSALEFGDKRVREVMVPRPDVIAISADSSLAELKAMLRGLSKNKHVERLPVYEKDIDHVAGVVTVHELLHVPDTELASQTVRSLTRPVLFVPESKSTADLMRELQQEGMQLAVVINEYGSVAGVVTMDDLVEEIVGEMPEEAGHPTPEWIEESPRQFVVDGTLDLDTLNELMNTHIESREATTVGGFLAETTGAIPQRGEKLQTQGLEFEVLEANAVRVLRLRVRSLEPAALESGSGDQGSGSAHQGNGPVEPGDTLPIEMVPDERGGKRPRANSLLAITLNQLAQRIGREAGAAEAQKGRSA